MIIYSLSVIIDSATRGAFECPSFSVHRRYGWNGKISSLENSFQNLCQSKAETSLL